MRIVIYIFILTAFVTQSCVNSKRLAKKANLLEQAGEHTAAADLFYQSVKKNPRNTTAVIGMKRTGTKVLNDYLKKFSKQAIQGQYKKATYTYLDAEQYQQKLAKININIEIPTSSQHKFTEVKQQYLSKKYDEGMKFINIEKFTKAEQCFNEVYKFDNSFKDVSELRNIAYLEPFYRNAEKLKKEKQYRKAYYEYQKILSRVSNYKDTRKNMNYVLEKGKTYITVSSKGRGSYASYSNNAKQYVINSIIKVNDPFIKVVDRADLDNIIKEQELTLSGMSKGNAEVGEIAGANFSVVVEVTSLHFQKKPVQKHSKTGYESYREKYLNKTTNTYNYRTKYKKVSYKEYRATKTMAVSTSYKIISLRTAEIIATEIVQKNYTSGIHYITYGGQKDKLYPSRDGRVFANSSAKSQLQSLMNGNKRFEDDENMRQKYYKYVGNNIGLSIVKRLQ